MTGQNLDYVLDFKSRSHNAIYHMIKLSIDKCVISFTQLIEELATKMVRITLKVGFLIALVMLFNLTISAAAYTQIAGSEVSEAVENVTSQQELISPAQSITLNVPFPCGTVHSRTQGFRSGHLAYDFGFGGGYEIAASAPGLVTFIEDSRSGLIDPSVRSCGNVNLINNWIVIQHDDGYQTEYYHIQQHSARNYGLQVGMRVERGQLIGLIGDVGCSTAPHLHYQYRNPQGDPIEPQFIEPLEFNGSQYVYRSQNSCAPPAGTLVVYKAVDWSGTVAQPGAAFEICVSGPGGSNCQLIPEGGSYSWGNLVPGTWTVTENGVGPEWIVTGTGTVNVAAGQSPSVTVTNTYNAPVCTAESFNPGLDLRHEQSLLLEASGFTTGQIVNRSTTCSYDVGIASYSEYDDVIDNQTLFASATGRVGPGQTITLSVAAPTCAAQIDLFYGEVLASLDGQRYGERLLSAAHINPGAWCVRPTPEATPETTPVVTPESTPEAPPETTLEAAAPVVPEAEITPEATPAAG